MSYINRVKNEIKEYFEILSPEFPEWLLEYIDIPVILRLQGISQACGTDWTNIYHHKYYYSVLEHSIGVALIIWNFTKDKKQTLSGLFHDISTPVFKHCVDFLNGDHENQESTEELTTEIIQNSKEIMYLLNRDNIKLEEVNDYKLYPIADNDSPKLSADRLEYTLSCSLYANSLNCLNLTQIKEIYDDITILKNENDIIEIGFNHKEIAESLINNCYKLWYYWYDNKDKIVMQFWADMIKKMVDKNLVTISDLYNLREQDIVDIIKNDETLLKPFELFQKAEDTYNSNVKIKNKYCVNITSKKRYINPLVRDKRIYDISDVSKKHIDNFKNFIEEPFVYVDFNF